MGDLASGRYDVMLSDEAVGAPPKRVKEANLEFMRSFVTLPQMLSTQRRPFSWKDALDQLRERGRRTWKAQLTLLKELRLPAPRVVPSDALKRFLAGVSADPNAARKSLVNSILLADKAPVDSE